MTVGWKTGLIKRKMLQCLKVFATMLLSHGNTDTLLASMVVARADLPLAKDMSPTEEKRKEKWDKFTKYSWSHQSFSNNANFRHDSFSLAHNSPPHPPPCPSSSISCMII